MLREQHASAWKRQRAIRRTELLVVLETAEKVDAA
jgi:hypothetical protein